MRNLDEVYNPHGIYFIWSCEYDEIDDSEFYNAGVTNVCSNMDMYDNDDGIDLFFVKVQGDPFGRAQNIVGKALVLGGTWQVNSAPLPAYLSNTLVHEMGHCLGLYHTYRGSAPMTDLTGCDGLVETVCAECADGSNSFGCGDFVLDTDAAHAWFNYNGSTCEFIPEDCADSPIYCDGCEEIPTLLNQYTPQMENYMGSAWPNCTNSFTDGQITRIHQVLSISDHLQEALIPFDYTSVHIEGSEIWTVNNTPNNGEIYIADDLIVEEGAELTIEHGVIIRFGKESRVIIHPNARLRLHGTLTSLGCSNMWEGVEVWGNSNASQYIVSGVNAQGQFYGREGSLIENANIGVKLYGPNYEENAGGIISCTDMEFRNTPVAMDFAPYQNYWPYSFPSQWTNQPRPYQAQITNCEFIVDDRYLYAPPFRYFVNMSLVSGPRFLGCDFTNQREMPNGEETDDWGYGIKASGSSFTVNHYCDNDDGPISTDCDDYDTNTFNGLGYGIFTTFASDGVPGDPPDDPLLFPCQVSYAEFNRCFVGVRVWSINGATVRHNQFNLGAMPQNNFENNQYGLSLEGGMTFWDIQNNVFENTNNSDLITVGIFADATGTATKAIRDNEFYGLSIGNLAQGTNAITGNQNRGLYYECNYNENIQAEGFDIHASLGRIRTQQAQLVELEPGNIEIRSAGNRFSNAGTIANKVRNDGIEFDYYFNEDGENESPKEVVGDVIPIFEGVNSNECETAPCIAPCLSDNEIDDAKKRFYKSRSNYKNLENEENSGEVLGNSGMLSEDNSVKLGYYQQEMDYSASQVVLHEVYDTLTYNKDTLITWLNNLGTIETQYSIVSNIYQTGNYNLAYQLLEEAKTEYAKSYEEAEDVELYIEILRLLEGKRLHTLEKNTLDKLWRFTDNGRNSKILARSILTFHGHHFPIEYHLGVVENREEFENDEDSNSINLKPFVFAYPNPATQIVNFVIPDEAQFINQSVSIHNLSGKIITKIPYSTSPFWDVELVDSGIYFYSIRDINGSHHSGKIIVK
ncbi:MAG: hypothetical protein ACI8YQ_004754 [Polaribacter sp.]|jgi:hypothetical protein